MAAMRKTIQPEMIEVRTTCGSSSRPGGTTNSSPVTSVTNAGEEIASQPEKKKIHAKRWIVPGRGGLGGFGGSPKSNDRAFYWSRHGAILTELPPGC